MADEEVKANEEIPAVPAETSAEVPAEAKQEELPLAAAEEAKTEEQPVEVKEEEKPEEINTDLPLWATRELGQKARKLEDARIKEQELLRELEAAKALAAKFNQSTERQPEFSGNLVPASEVDKRAAEFRAQERYVEECNKAAKNGETVYGQNWKEAVSNLQMLGGFDQPTMNGALATDDPAKVLYELGKNPDNYHRIMDMPLERRIVEMSKLAMQPTQAKKVSNAPPPVAPVGGKAAPAAATLRDDMDDDTYHKIRMAQRAKRWEERNGIRR